MILIVMDATMELLLMDDDVGMINMNVFNLAFPLHDENIEERNHIPRNQEYFEITIPSYTDFQFREHFRMSRRTFAVLLNKIGNLNEGDHRIIPLDKKLLFTMWLLSKPESFLAAGDRFDIPKSTGHNIFYEIINLICQLMIQFIKWPADHTNTINVFKNRSRGIPGIVGAIDGCHIPMKQPEGNAQDYYNRKQFHSIILQGICNEHAMFIDINIGQPGRMHDSRVFRLSPIYDRIIDRRNPLLATENHIIGDSAYPLMINLLKPYQDNGHLTNEENNFNIKLSSVRSTIERCFGLLKGKFRRLKYLDVSTPESATKIVGAACVLHNFILQEKNEEDGYNVEDDFPLNDINGLEPGDAIRLAPAAAREAAEVKRRAITYLVADQL